MKSSIMIAAAALALSATAAPAAAAGWELIGTRSFGGEDQGDNVIPVQSDRRYDRVKICVYGNAVRIDTVIFDHHDGLHMVVSIRKRIKASGCTRSIALTGGQRQISTISMNFDAKNGNYGYGPIAVKVFAK